MIRRATPEDAPRIASLEARCAWHPWSETAIRAALHAPAGLGFVAEHGYLIGTAVAGEGEIQTLGVLPTARRTGLGRALVDAILGAWRNGAVREGFLEVRERNEAARALYHSTGWRVVGERRDYYGAGEHALLMRWTP